MNILHRVSKDDIEAVVGEKVASNIISATSGNAKVHSGGGGVYGKVVIRTGDFWQYFFITIGKIKEKQNTSRII